MKRMRCAILLLCLVLLCVAAGHMLTVHYGHHCSGLDCPICQAHIRELLALGAALLLLCALLACLCLASRSLHRPHNGRRTDTPISNKVLLLC